MTLNFNPIQLLEEAARTQQTGYLQVIANSVTWELYFIEGRLQYAHYSLQSLEVIEHYLLRLGYAKAAKVVPILAQHIPDNRRFIIHMVGQLASRNFLTASQKSALMQELTQDALESLLWVTEAEYHCHSLNPFQSESGAIAVGENLLEIHPLLRSLQIRLNGWQQLAPFLSSPHQRPRCVNRAIAQPVPLGKLSPATFEKLVQLMQGVSIRRLGLLLNLDELKVAQLLLPYVKHKVIHLDSPKPSLSQLPLIPSLLIKEEPSSTSILPATKNPTPVTSKAYKIACIDDSPTILNTFKSYLGAEGYEIIAIDNPMKAISGLFECKPDLILMDISMPGINGNRLSHILKSSPVFKTIPIIFVTSNTKVLNPETLQASGATDYLAKPFTSESLQAMVKKYLKGGVNLSLASA